MLPPIALETAQRPQSSKHLQVTSDVSAPSEFEVVLASVRFEANKSMESAETETKPVEEKVRTDGESTLQEDAHQGVEVEADGAPENDEDLRELHRLLADTDQSHVESSAQVSGFEPPEDSESMPPFIAASEAKGHPLTQDEEIFEQVSVDQNIATQLDAAASEQVPQQLPYRYSEIASVMPLSQEGQSNASGQDQNNDELAPMGLEKRPAQIPPQAFIVSPAEAKRVEVVQEPAPQDMRDMAPARVGGKDLPTDVRGLVSRASPDEILQVTQLSTARFTPENTNWLHRVQSGINGLKDLELHGSAAPTERAEPLPASVRGAGSAPSMPFTSDKFALSNSPAAVPEPIAEEMAGGMSDDGALPAERPFSPLKEATLQVRTVGSAPASSVDHSGSVARQVADVVRISPGGVVDVSLRPDELGAVRLSMKAAEGQMTVIVLAERTDTLDLMRRNIDGLSHEFKELGYENVSFSFQSGGGNQSAQQQELASAVGAKEDTNPTNRAEDQRVLLVGSGLDIRI